MDEPTDVRPEAEELQVSLLRIAEEGRCTFEEIILAACSLAGNAIAQAHMDHDQTRARIKKAAHSIEFIVNWALANRAPTESRN